MIKKIPFEELTKNISRFDEYPIPLNIVVPLNDLPVIMRKNSFSGVITNLPDPIWQRSNISKLAGDHYEVIRDTFIRPLPQKR